jgi:hypothetical protein
MLFLFGNTTVPSFKGLEVTNASALAIAYCLLINVAADGTIGWEDNIRCMRFFCASALGHLPHYM